MSMASELLALRKEVKALRREFDALKARTLTQSDTASTDDLALALRAQFVVDRDGHRMTLADIRQVLTSAGVTIGDDHSAAIGLGRALVRFGAWRRRTSQGYFYEGLRPRVEVEQAA